MVTIIRGDLLEAKAPFICQQVNCQGAMGSGLAKQIADKWPDVKNEYIRMCNKLHKDTNLLGKVQFVKLTDKLPTVVNVFGQYDYGHFGPYTDYVALRKAFREINRKCRGKTVAFPYGFGCGLDGGDWIDVEQLIVKNLPDCDVQIYMK